MKKTIFDIPKKMKTAVLMEKGRIEMEERPVPLPALDQVLVKVSSIGICGSDVHYYREGRIGDFIVNAPLVLGHEVSGLIVAVGGNVSTQRIGERVSIEPQRPCYTCAQCLAGRYNLCPEMEFYATPPIDGAFQEYVVIQSAFAHAVPDSVTDEEAALLEPLSVGIWACQKAQVTCNSRVLIAGAGPIGIIMAQTAKAFGASEIIVSDVIEVRRQNALRFGATRVLDPMVESVADLGVDVFIDCSGATPAITSGITAVRAAGHVVLVGMGADEVPIPLPILQVREITLTGTFRYSRTWPIAIHLAASKKIDLLGMITGRYKLEQAEDALKVTSDAASLKPIVQL